MTPRLAFGAALLVLAAPSAFAQSPGQAGDKADVVMQAMRDEMARSIKELKLDTLPKPYFIAYRVTEGQGLGASARLGSLLSTGAGRGSRYLQVEMRVGDYAFDNTNYFGAGFMPAAFVGTGAIPLDDDYQEIRRQLWLSTDRAYKQAVEALSQKRAALETRSATEAVPDFSHEPVTNTVEEIPLPVVNRGGLDSLARDLSVVFKATPEIYNSSVSVSTGVSRVRYLNSDGTSYVSVRPSAGVNVQAFTQAADGMPLTDYYSVTGRVAADLPSRDTLIARTRALSSRLVKLRATPLAESYDGPVLFEGDAAGELLNTVLAPKLVGTRKPVTSQMFEAVLQMQGASGNDWLDLVGARVLPSFLSVLDDPTLSSIDGFALPGGYRVDEEGVAARPTKVIERGILKTLLMTRVPVAGIGHSTGSRRGNGATPSHVIVSSDSGLAPDDMRRKLLALATADGRDYAIVVRRLANPHMTGQMDPSVAMIMAGGRPGADPPIRTLVAVKVYPDGHEEQVRGAEITGLGASALKSIVAVSKTRTVYSTGYFSTASIFAGGGSGLVTYVTPSLLFDNVSIRKPKESNPRPPVVAPPR